MIIFTISIEEKIFLGRRGIEIHVKARTPDSTTELEIAEADRLKKSIEDFRASSKGEIQHLKPSIRTVIRQ